MSREAAPGPDNPGDRDQNHPASDATNVEANGSRPAPLIGTVDLAAEESRVVLDAELVPLGETARVDPAHPMVAAMAKLSEFMNAPPEVTHLPPVERLNLALELAAAGYHLAPVIIRRGADGMKVPDTRRLRWSQLSTVDPMVIRDWFAQYGDHVSFLVDTGKSAVVGIDLDVDPHSERSGEGVWESAGIDHGAMAVRTPSGGWHHYYAADQDETLTVAKRVHGLPIDVRARGGCLFAPGSVVIGTDGEPEPSGYALGRDGIVPASELTPLPLAARTLLGARTGQQRRQSEPGEHHDRWWIEQQMAEQANRVRTHVQRHGLREGTGFRGVLLGAGMVFGRAIGAGVIGWQDAEGQLREAVAEAWGHADALDERWIRSGISDGQAEAWTAVTERELPRAEPTADDAPAVGAERAADEPAPDVVSSWAPVDLAAALADDYEPPRPTLLPRVDGPALLYAGAVHSIYGESESGKSWVAQIVVANALRSGGRALYVDHESDAHSVCGRLLALGVPRDVLTDPARFTYVRPDGPRDARWLDLLDAVYDVAVVDGVNVAMSTENLSTDGTDDAARWYDRVPRALADRTGAAVITVDHVTKARDSRGRFMIGSQSKMNAITGSAFLARVRTPFGRGQVGVLILRVTKDRPGAVRPECGPPDANGTQEAARVVLDARNPSAITVRIECWSGDATERDELAPLDWADDWNEPTQPALPADVAGYCGSGASAVPPLARFLRRRAVGGVGVTMAEARAAVLVKLAAIQGKPKLSKDTINRAWGALVDLGRVDLAEGATAATGRSHWVQRPGDPTP